MIHERITRTDIEHARQRFIEENLLLTPIEVAEMLRISVRTVFKLIEDGTISRVNGYANAGKTRIRAATVREYRERIEV